MINSEIMDALNEAEAAFAVDRWSVDGVRVWPIVRIRWALDVFAACHTPSIDPARRGRQPARRLGAVCRAVSRYVRARILDREHEISRRQPFDAVLLSDGVSYLRVGGRAYERFCDPVVAYLADRGRRSLLLNPLRQCPSPRHSPSWQVQPWLDLLRIRTAAVGHLSPGAHHLDLEGYRDASNLLASRGPLRPLPSDGVVHLARVVESWSSHFERLLRRARPRAAFLVSYYSLVGFAFSRACRRLAIPCADFQHGVAGELHPAYGRWHKVPNDGYDLLPSRFWCWSDRDKAAIDRWSSPVAEWHRADVGGNLLLEQWRAGREDAAMAGEDHQARQLLRPGAFHVLVTLQPGLTGPAALGPLLNAVPRLPAHVRFWVRLHPVMVAGADATAGLPSDRCEVEKPSTLPLYGLLRYADLHVTHSSSAVVEAARFGVGSLVLSRYGFELFPSEARAGLARLADDPAEVERAIATAPRPAREQVKRDAHEALARAYELLDSLVA